MGHLLHFRGAPFSVCLACSARGPLQDPRSHTLLFLPVELLRNFPQKFSCSVVSDSAPHGLRHASLPCASLSPGVCLDL